jgi:hypothetical protein
MTDSCTGNQSLSSTSWFFCIRVVLIDRGVSGYREGGESCELKSATKFRSLIHRDRRLRFARAEVHAYLGLPTSWATVSLAVGE